MTALCYNVYSGKVIVQGRLTLLAAGAADEVVCFVNKFGQTLTLKSFSYIPDNALTGDNTNYMSLAVRNKGTAGVGTTAMTSTKAYTLAVDIAAMDESALTVSATEANKLLATDEVMALNKTETGSGLILSGNFVAVFEFDSVST